MTPAINTLKNKKISHNIHEYSHDKSSESYGLEAVEKMGVNVENVFKTLVVQIDNKLLAVGVLPVSSQLSMKLIAKALGAKKAMMADKSDVERSTGYVLGGVSPMGQKIRLKTVIDASVKKLATVYVSAGRRGLEIELAPSDLVKLTHATVADICL